MSSMLDMFAMKRTKHTSENQRKEILAELNDITTMERGTLAEEYRERPAPDGQGAVRLGPYFKHQCWEDGRNRSRRVPVAEVEALSADLDNAQRFEALTSELANLAIAEGRVKRGALATNARSEVKKNSGKKASGKGTAKPKPSSRRSRSASRKKA